MYWCYTKSIGIGLEGNSLEGNLFRLNYSVGGDLSYWLRSERLMVKGECIMRVIQIPVLIRAGLMQFPFDFLQMGVDESEGISRGLFWECCGG